MIQPIIAQSIACFELAAAGLLEHVDTGQRGAKARCMTAVAALVRFLALIG